MSYDATQALIKALDANSDRAAVLSNLQQVNVTANEASGQEVQFNSGETSWRTRTGKSYARWCSIS